MIIIILSLLITCLGERLDLSNVTYKMSASLIALNYSHYQLRFESEPFIIPTYKNQTDMNDKIVAVAVEEMVKDDNTWSKNSEEVAEDLRKIIIEHENEFIKKIPRRMFYRTSNEFVREVEMNKNGKFVYVTCTITNPVTTSNKFTGAYKVKCEERKNIKALSTNKDPTSLEELMSMNEEIHFLKRRSLSFNPQMIVIDGNKRRKPNRIDTDELHLSLDPARFEGKGDYYPCGKNCRIINYNNAFKKEIGIRTKNWMICNEPLLGWLNSDLSCSNSFLGFSFKNACYFLKTCSKEEIIVRNGTSNSLMCTEKPKNKRCVSNYRVDSDATCSQFEAFEIDLTNLQPEEYLKACSITGETININNCNSKDITKIERQVTLIQADSKFAVFYSHNIREIHNPKTIEHYNCSSKCNQGNCDGDEIYRDNFGYQTVSDEYCGYMKLKRYQIVLKGVAYNITCYKVEKVIIGIETESLLPEWELHDSIQFECRKNGVFIKGPKITDRVTIQVSRGEMEYYKMNITLNKMILLPYEFLSKLSHDDRKTKLNIKLGVASKFKVFELECPVEEFCNLIHCTFCYSKLQNIHCFTAVEWLIFSSVILVLTFVFIFLFSKILTKCFKFELSVKVLCYPIYDLWLRCRMHAYKYKKNKERNILYDETRLELLKENKRKLSSKNDIALPKYTTKYKPPNSTLIIVIIFSYFICNVLSTEPTNCIKTSNLEILTNDCDNTGCKIKTTIRDQIQLKGDTLCYNFRLKDTILGQWNMEVLEIEEICELDLLYYVPDADIECHSRQVCRTNKGCSDDQCEKFPPNGTLEHLKEFENQAGFYACDRVCGCWACGCFICTDSCMYTRANLNRRSNEVFTVGNCGKWNIQIKVRTTFNDGENVKSKINILKPGITVLDDLSQITFISDVSSEVSLDNCLMYNSNSAAFVPCNAKGELIKGKLGEIQCPSLESAKTLSKSCYFPTNLVTIRAGSDSSQCTSEMISITKLLSLNSIPMNYHNGIIDFEDNTLKYKAKSATPIEIQVDVKGFKLKKISNEMKCSVKSSKLSGCYLCTTGSLLELVIKSEKKGTSHANIKCPSSSSESMLVVSDTETDYKIRLHFTKAKIQEECTIECSGGTDNFEVTGELVYITNSNPDREGISVGSDISKGSWNLINLFQTTWFKWIITFIILILVALVILKLIKYFFTMYRKKV